MSIGAQPPGIDLTRSIGVAIARLRFLIAVAAIATGVWGCSNSYEADVEPTSGAYWPTMLDYRATLPPLSGLNTAGRAVVLRPYEQYAVAYVAEACVTRAKRSYEGFELFVDNHPDGLTTTVASIISKLAAVSTLEGGNARCTRPFLEPSGLEVRLGSLLVAIHSAGQRNPSSLMPGILEGQSAIWLRQPVPRPPLVLWLCCDEVEGGWRFKGTSETLVRYEFVAELGRSEDTTPLSVAIEAARAEIRSLDLY